MTLYYIIFSFLLISCTFEIATTKIKYRVLILWGLFFTLFGGLRWQTGGDWEQYYDHFCIQNGIIFLITTDTGMV